MATGDYCRYTASLLFGGAKMNMRKISLFVIAAFSIAMVTNSFAQTRDIRRAKHAPRPQNTAERDSGPQHRSAHRAARMNDRERTMERMQDINKSMAAPDYASSSGAQLVVTTHTPDSIAPIVITQIDDHKIILSALPLESFDVEPGVHAIVVAPRSDPTNGERVTIDVQPGVRYYIGWHESEPALWREEGN